MSLALFMYHRVFPETLAEGVSRDMFRRQLDYLQTHYRMLRAADVEKFVSGELTVKEPCAALSFDDGWCDNFFFAHDILKERALSALLAVSSDHLWDGEVRTGESPELFTRSSEELEKLASCGGSRRAYCNRAELREMESSGVWRLEAHGSKHELGDAHASILSFPQNGMNAETFQHFLAADLQNCRRELESLTGRRHRILFWPWGHYSTPAVETARRCGFDIQFTVVKGTISPGDRGVLPRVGVSPKWKKFHRNAVIFRNPLLTFLHRFSRKSKVCFDDNPEVSR